MIRKEADMKLKTTLAACVTALTIGVAGAAADPDGYQPSLQGQATSDAVDRYLRNNAPPVPDALERYLRNNTPPPYAVGSNGAADHPDSLGARPTLVAGSEFASDGRDWTVGAFGALGGALLALLAIAGASAMRERRRLVLR
jgi:hypothetical protein